MPDRIKGAVRALVLRPQAVLLDAVRVGVKHVGMAMVVERIQPQPYLVVIVNQLAPQHARPNLARLLVKGQKHRIKTLVGVPQIGFG